MGAARRTISKLDNLWRSVLKHVGMIYPSSTSTYTYSKIDEKYSVDQESVGVNDVKDEHAQKKLDRNFGTKQLDRKLRQLP